MSEIKYDTTTLFPAVNLNNRGRSKRKHVDADDEDRNIDRI